MLVSQTTTSYTGGVSQQPDIIRYPNQVEEQINAYPSEVQGLQKRPPTINIGKLREKDNLAHKYHMINRDETEQYILEMSSGKLRVWDLEGNEKKVTIQDDLSYLTTSDPENDFRAVTVADYTFILNRKVETYMNSSTSSSGSDGTSLIYIKNAQYAKAYGIFKGSEWYCGVLTPDGGEAKQAVQTNTSFIARALANLLSGSYNFKGMKTSWDDLLNQTGGASNMIYGKSGKNVSNGLYGDVIAVSGTDWEIKDSFGNQNAYVIKNYVTTTSKLPPTAPDGYKVHVKGAGSSTDDDYWLYYSASKSAWIEGMAPYIKYSINSSSMPHALVRNSDGSFTFKRLSWADRAVGDDDSNPVPSFIGNTISDIFFYRNRLGFISDENIILSASADFFNFWFNSAVAVADTDPIDIAVSSNKVSLLDAAVPFARELMLFSKEGQFVLSSDGVMTSKNVKVDQITTFDYSNSAMPISVGQSIFFVNDRVDYTSLMRFYTVQDVADLKNAEDVSAHIPTYINIGISRLSGNTKDNFITLISKTVPNTVWLYKYIIQNGQSMQEAWGKWTFGYEGSRVYLAECLESLIYILIESDGGLYLESMQIRGNAIDFDEEPYRLFMDRKVKYKVPDNAHYSDFADTTTMSLMDIYKSVPHGDSTYYVINTDGSIAGVISSWNTEAGQFTVNGDLRGKTVFVGRKFETKIVLSKQYIKEQTDTGGVSASDEGRLQLRNYWLNCADSGVFTCNVDNLYKNTHYSYTSTGRYLGRSDNTLGTYSSYTTKYKFPIQNLNTETTISIVSDNPQPLNIVSGGWEGFYYKRTKQI